MVHSSNAGRPRRFPHPCAAGPSLVLAAFLFVPSAAAAAAVCSRPMAHAHVDRVVDGDTVIVRIQSTGRPQRERVRLLRINTPEKGQRGATEATAQLEELLAGQEVTLEFETAALERDQHQRLLAYVCVGNTNANIEQVRRGWSRFWSKYGCGRLADAFDQAETQARAARRGLWSWTPSRDY